MTCIKCCKMYSIKNVDAAYNLTGSCAATAERISLPHSLLISSLLFSSPPFYSPLSSSPLLSSHLERYQGSAALVAAVVREGPECYCRIFVMTWETSRRRRARIRIRNGVIFATFLAISLRAIAVRIIRCSLSE